MTYPISRIASAPSSAGTQPKKTENPCSTLSPIDATSIRITFPCCCRLRHLHRPAHLLRRPLPPRPRRPRGSRARRARASQRRLDALLVDQRPLGDHDPFAHHQPLRDDELLLEQRDRDRAVRQRLDLARVVLLSRNPLDIDVLARDRSRLGHALDVRRLARGEAPRRDLAHPDGELLLMACELDHGDLLRAGVACVPAAGHRRDVSTSPSTSTCSLRTSSRTISVSVSTPFSTPIRSLATACFCTTASSAR